MARVNSYIDGFNLYHAIDVLNKPWLKWINLRLLSETFLIDGEVLNDTHFFTTLSTWDGEKRKRHINYIAALKECGVSTHYGSFKKAKKFCSKTGNQCSFYEEKHTDVSLACKLVADAFDDKFDRAILVTSDIDQLPSVGLVKSRFPEKAVTIIAPPGRISRARELFALSNEKLEISPGRLGTCIMPRSIKNVAGKTVATMPASYLREISN